MLCRRLLNESCAKTLQSHDAATKTSNKMGRKKRAISIFLMAVVRYLPGLTEGPFPDVLGLASVVDTVRCANESDSEHSELGMDRCKNVRVTSSDAEASASGTTFLRFEYTLWRPLIP